LTLIFLFINLNIYSQNNELREVTLSPNEKLIAFTYHAEKVLDVFIYDLEKDSIIKITDSSGLNFDQQYKTFLNWIDNERLIFISKHNGLAQQYILDIKANTFDIESISSDHEYNLKYLKVNNKTYYTSSRKGKEPAVFCKTVGEKDEKKISKGNINCMLTSISADGKYLSYKEMPIGKPHLISLEDGKEIKLKIPQKNTTISEWSAASDKFIYKNSYFKDDDRSPVFDIKLYDLGTDQTIEIATGMNYIFGGLWSPCDKYFYTLLDKSILLDLNTNTKKEYKAIGTPIAFMNNCQSVLFMQKKRIFIINLLDDSIKNIVKENN